MTIFEWITLTTVFVSWAGSIVIFWNKVQIKLKELDIKLMNIDEKLTEKHSVLERDIMKHIEWGEAEQEKNIKRFDQHTQDLRDTQVVLIQKIDRLIEAFNDFRLYSEQNFRHKD